MELRVPRIPNRSVEARGSVATVRHEERGEPDVRDPRCSEIPGHEMGAEGGWPVAPRCQSERRAREVAEWAARVVSPDGPK